SLSAVQRRWSTYEKEAWAIVSSIHKLDYFLRGHHFTLHTDHRNLTFLRTDTSAKVGRWFLSLSEYSFDIIHVAGAQNGAADCLSRLPIKKGPVKSQVLCVQPIGLEFDANNALVKELLELQKEYPVEEELEKTEN
ncbi:hypothetical protein ADUPG1_002572, partial [Aduncisulcus paluster]